MHKYKIVLSRSVGVIQSLNYTHDIPGVNIPGVEDDRAISLYIKNVLDKEHQKERKTYTGSNFTETSVAMWLFPDTYIIYP